MNICFLQINTFTLLSCFGKAKRNGFKILSKYRYIKDTAADEECFSETNKLPSIILLRVLRVLLEVIMRTITYSEEIPQYRQPGGFTIIPAAVRYDKRLKANEKLLYAEIVSLTHTEGYCWANNNYFAELFEVTKTSISYWISHLTECGHLNSVMVYKKGTKQIIGRKLYLTVSMVEGYSDSDDKGIKEKFKTPLKKSLIRIKEKFKDNNINYNKNKKIKLHSSSKELEVEEITEQSNNIAADSGEHSTKEKTKPPIKERNQRYLPLVRHLAQTIKSNKNITIPPARLQAWANEVRRLDDEIGGDIVRIKNVLTWYRKNIGGEYIPVVESGSALRLKFLRLEEAIQRENKPRNLSGRIKTARDSVATPSLHKPWNIIKG